MAGFLIIASLTGTLLAFHKELDDWFNRDLAYIQASEKPPLAIADLHDKVITTYPNYKFSSMPTSIETGRTAVFLVDRARGKKTSATSKATFQEVYLNPFTGEIIGTRDKEQWQWRNTMWKVFWLHRDLLLGDIGKWLLGMVSLIWTMNCFIGFYLTLPRRTKALNTKKTQAKGNSKALIKKRASLLKRWLPAWKIRRKTNTFKLNYDLHHAFGLWLWLMLFAIAWSSVGFNLRAVYQPVMQAVVGLEPRGERPRSSGSASQALSAKDTKVASDYKIDKANSIAYLSTQAEIAAQKNGVSVEQLLGLRWVEENKQWQMRFTTNKDVGTHGGASSITVDATTGNVEKVNFGYQSAVGNKTDQWLSALHMGHIAQGPNQQLGHRLYQVFLALIGLVVSVLSVTGVYLWVKGHRSRSRQRQKLTVKKTFQSDNESLAIKKQL